MKTSLIFFLLFINLSAFCQSICDTLGFINCQKNSIQITESEKEKIKQALDSGSLRIVHIGDSHLQAAFLSEKIKQLLNQNLQNKSNIASPGFIFPFSMAQTNNPFFFKIDYSGSWTRTRNVDEFLNSPIGISGITVSSKSPNMEIKIKMENRKFTYKSKYFFDKAVLLHNTCGTATIMANNCEGIADEHGTTWTFEAPIDSIVFSLINSDTTKQIDLYGIILELKNSPIQYHTIGVNGSMAKSYLKCELFEDHLSLLNPNLVIVSLGTNEAFSKDFSRDDFILNFTNLLSKIHNSNPDAAIIITIPNDHFKDGLSNQQVGIVRECIYHLSNYFSFGIWDYYEIMGGTGSINDWHKKKLAADDRLHFNRKGYEIQGELFFDAFINMLNSK
ncbi:MAG: GDSL-type esterase/lipase family protein [Bacteroidales bacterium]